jgi:hypothetical protein
MGIETILLVGVAWCIPSLLSLALARVAGRADDYSAAHLAIALAELPLGPRRITGGPRTPVRRRSQSELRV